MPKDAGGMQSLLGGQFFDMQNIVSKSLDFEENYNKYHKSRIKWLSEN